MSIIAPPLCIDELHHAYPTAQSKVHEVLQRIARDDNRAIIEINPDAYDIAAYYDQKPMPYRLHGVPVLIKDNVDTGDRMHTTAGSRALLSSRAAGDAFAITRLRATGAIPIAKANMSEWANFRSTRSSSGYSSRGGQCLNPHDATRCPSGSSSGSAAAVAAGLVSVAVGSETDGSIISPSARCGVVGIKPTVGLISRRGVIPISATQDTLGAHATSVTDAHTLIATLAGVDPHDRATHAIPSTLLNALSEALDAQSIMSMRIGVARKHYSGYHSGVDDRFQCVVDLLTRHGVTVVDDVEIDTVSELRSNPHDHEYVVMCYEFKIALAAYLATRSAMPGYAAHDIPRTLADIIAFNERHPNPGFFFGQEILTHAESYGAHMRDAYRKSAAWCKRKSQREGIDATIQRHQLDAIIVPSGSPAWPIDQINGDPNMRSDSTTVAACAGYPLITIPMGKIQHLPIGLTIMGTAWSDAKLMHISYGIEQLLAQAAIN